MNELTRRAWILRLRGVAALTGISGLVPGDAKPTELPPGLYKPSLDHLAHAIKAMAEPAVIPAAPEYFSSEDFELIQTLTGIMLGQESSTPPVPEIAAWIDLIVGQSAAVRMAALALSPAHRRLAADHYGEEVVRELEMEDLQALCGGGLTALKREHFVALDKAPSFHASRLSRTPVTLSYTGSNVTF